MKLDPYEIVEESIEINEASLQRAKRVYNSMKKSGATKSLASKPWLKKGIASKSMVRLRVADNINDLKALLRRGEIDKAEYAKRLSKLKLTRISGY